jgi:hypothetical protein
MESWGASVGATGCPAEHVTETASQDAGKMETDVHGPRKRTQADDSVVFAHQTCAVRAPVAQGRAHS